MISFHCFAFGSRWLRSELFGQWLDSVRVQAHLHNVFGDINFGGCRIYMDYSGDLDGRLPMTSFRITISLGMVDTFFTYSMKSRGMGKQ